VDIFLFENILLDKLVLNCSGCFSRDEKSDEFLKVKEFAKGVNSWHG
jgi:hypothetical protein